MPHMMEPGEEQIVAERLVAVLAARQVPLAAAAEAAVHSRL
eukprot:SAG25_NODE_400_length_8482_cov_73.962901_8_plen_41_part_00